MAKLINLTNHKLNEDQLKEAVRLGLEVVEKEAFLDPNIIKQLQNTPSDVVELQKLANTVGSSLKRFVEPGDVLHLPIGSPAFMWLLQQKLENIPNLNVVFSHTNRIMKENPETGEKVSVFKFEKFINVSGNLEPSIEESQHLNP